MKILIVRHGDPNYAIDSLTGRGWREAELLADYLPTLPIDYCYVSPHGRAQDTASLTLAKIDKRAKVLDWLKEFPSRIHRPDREDTIKCAWDWLPADWTAREVFYDKDRWFTEPIMAEGDVEKDYMAVKNGLDALLAEHGYVREGNVFRAVRPNSDTIVLFCHFGLECVVLSCLLGVSPMVLWHGMCAAPSSVTTVVTEERREGIASFRMTSFGETFHLKSRGVEPSFHARFCECYTNVNERHD